MNTYVAIYVCNYVATYYWMSSKCWNVDKIIFIKYFICNLFWSLYTKSDGKISFIWVKCLCWRWKLNWYTLHKVRTIMYICIVLVCIYFITYWIIVASLNLQGVWCSEVLLIIRKYWYIYGLTRIGCYLLMENDLQNVYLW